MATYLDLIKEAEFWKGYRKCFLDLHDRGFLNLKYGKNTNEDKIYKKAIIDFVSQRWENMRDYVTYGIDVFRFYNFKRNKKGDLISCEFSKIKE
jgi:hypothetical protein